MATNLRPNKTTIEALELPAKGQSLHFFNAPSGFGLRITPKGTRTFFLQYRAHGKEHRINIGRYGTITVQQAQKEAQRLCGIVSSGGDPKAEREAAAQAVRRADAEKQWTLGRAVDRYLEERQLKESTIKDMKRALAGMDDWKRKPLQDITPTMVKQRHAKLSKASQARANLAMRYLRAVINLSMADAQAEGFTLLGSNPVDTLSHRKAWNTVRRRRTLIPQHKLGAWLDAVESLADRPKSGPMQRDFLMLTLLTGLRLNEARGLRWADVDFDGRTLLVRDPKNHDDHELPLGDYLTALLLRRRDESGPEFVFSNEAGHRLHNLRYALEYIEEQTGVRATAHDLRRTFATIAEGLGLSAYAIKQALNHRVTAGDVTAGYVQVTPERLREPMQRIESFILSHGSKQRAAKVVPLRQGGVV